MKDNRLKFGGWIVILVLLVILVASIVVAYLGWNSTDTAVPISGYVAMALGIVFSLLVVTCSPETPPILS
jgi:hypothetical protein